jgi:SAM-dependent methyltransferase
MATADVDLYGPSYRNFASALYSQVRSDAFGQDIGQTGWITADEQDTFIAWLGLSDSCRLLDLACGSGGPTLRLAERTGCSVCGIDQHAEGITAARALAKKKGLEDRSDFKTGDATARLPFAAESFDAITCFDAINHFPDRAAALAEWRRVLKRGGRLLFTDPIVLTGPVSHEEIAVRASIGRFIFVPPGLDELLLIKAGYTVERVEDRTQNMALSAAAWLNARKRRELDLRAVEGDAGFDGQNRFLHTAATLAAERRLSRLAFLALPAA